MLPAFQSSFSSGALPPTEASFLGYHHNLFLPPEIFAFIDFGVPQVTSAPRGEVLSNVTLAGDLILS